MHSKVTDISEDRIKEHFIKRFSGWLEGLGSYKNALKKGGGGSLGPSPRSAYAIENCGVVYIHFEKL